MRLAWELSKPLKPYQALRESIRFSPEKTDPALFLHRKFNGLSSSKEVTSAVTQITRDLQSSLGLDAQSSARSLSDFSPSELATAAPLLDPKDAKKISHGLKDPVTRILLYLDRLKQFENKSIENPRIKERIKAKFFNKYLTSIENVPEEFYQLQTRLARQQGHGNITLTPEQKKELAEINIADQKDSLGQWLDYFMSPDSSSYPLWAKYWSLRDVTKLGKFDPNTGKFMERSKGSMVPFPELNHEALALAVDAI